MSNHRVILKLKSIFFWNVMNNASNVLNNETRIEMKIIVASFRDIAIFQK